MKTPPTDQGKNGVFDEAETHSDSNVRRRFSGTDNPRHLRALNGLLRRPMPREHLDREAGASNGPALIAELRDRGLSIPCDRAPVIDRDGREVQRGIYRLTERDRRRIRFWLRRRGAD